MMKEREYQQQIKNRKKEIIKYVKKRTKIALRRLYAKFKPEI